MNDRSKLIFQKEPTYDRQEQLLKRRGLVEKVLGRVNKVL